MLTDTKIKQAKPAEKPYKLFDERGLYLIVTPSGGKWWRLKYYHGGKEKLLALGTYPDVPLRDARERRDDARKKLAAEVDPNAERKAAKQQREDSFEAVAREWCAKFSASWVEEHTTTVIGRLEKNVFPWLGTLPIAEITAPELLTALRRIESRGAVEVARRVNQVCGAVFRYAIATGRASRDVSTDLRGALAPVVEKHHGAVTDPKEVATLMRALNGYQGSFIVRCALRFSALTFARPGEIRKATWSEIDLDNATWRISAERMKMRREHIVPLSRQAVEVLRELRPLTGSGLYVFPGNRSADRAMSENTICAALRYLGYAQGKATAHGFRSTASTLLHEMGWQSDVIERQLAHVEQNAIKGAYNRAEHLPERTRMMQAWADYLDGSEKVVPLRATA
ncbi:MAG: tyrosine-type recombinase/integrase [Deltaproteobacteria bacterium]|nr:tyrosine-type recombinase/integrase [Deltaproteobacteria bacterium]